MAKNEIQRVDKTTDIATIDPDSPAGIMMQLMSNGGGDKFDVDGFGKMLEFQERHDANKARKVFASDFAVAQSNIDAVVKTKVNPQTHSKYADLDGVIEVAKPVYTNQGFSIIYYEGETSLDGHMRLCADVLHKEGHKEKYHIDIPLDGVGIKGNANMTKIHGKASSISYGRRYLLCMIWNIPTQDDDGNAAGKKPTGVKPPTADEQDTIDAICTKIPTPDGKMVDAKKVAAICYEKEQRYPDKELVGRVVAWFTEFDRPEIFIPIPKDEFDEHVEQHNAKTDAEKEAEGTAAEKFGGEAMYQCQKCGLEFDTPKEAAECIH